MRRNSSVRAPFGSAVLTSPGMQAPFFFHPKVYALEDTTAQRVVILSGSANLTHGGLLDNVENLFEWSGPTTDPVAHAFDIWWTGVWAGRAPRSLNPAFISAYTAARPKLPTPPPPPGMPPAGPAPATLWAANSLWVELVRKPEGGSYNQVELLLTAHHFFYPNVAGPSESYSLGPLLSWTRLERSITTRTGVFALTVRRSDRGATACGVSTCRPQPKVCGAIKAATSLCGFSGPVWRIGISRDCRLAWPASATLDSQLGGCGHKARLAAAPDGWG